MVLLIKKYKKQSQAIKISAFVLLKQIFSVEHILTNPGEDREIDMQLIKQQM